MIYGRQVNLNRAFALWHVRLEAPGCAEGVIIRVSRQLHIEQQKEHPGPRHSLEYDVECEVIPEIRESRSTLIGLRKEKSSRLTHPKSHFVSLKLYCNTSSVSFVFGRVANDTLAPVPTHQGKPNGRFNPRKILSCSCAARKASDPGSGGLPSPAD